MNGGVPLKLRVAIFLCLIILLSVFHVNAAVADCISEEEAIAIALTWIQEKYSSLEPEQMALIEVEKTFHEPSDQEPIESTEYHAWTVFFYYKEKDYLHTYVVVDAETGNVIDFDPWDFSAPVQFYDTIPQEEWILEIAYQEYNKQMEEAKNNFLYANKLADFLDQYGEEGLIPAEQMLVEIYLTNIPYYSPNWYQEEKAQWYIKFKHPLQQELNGTDSIRGFWLEIRYDVSGNILDTTDRFFSIYDETLYRWY